MDLMYGMHFGLHLYRKVCSFVKKIRAIQIEGESGISDAPNQTMSHFNTSSCSSPGVRNLVLAGRLLNGPEGLVAYDTEYSGHIGNMVTTWLFNWKPPVSSAV